MAKKALSVRVTAAGSSLVRKCAAFHPLATHPVVATSALAGQPLVLFPAGSPHLEVITVEKT